MCCIYNRGLKAINHYADFTVTNTPARNPSNEVPYRTFIALNHTELSIISQGRSANFWIPIVQLSCFSKMQVYDANHHRSVSDCRMALSAERN